MGCKVQLTTAGSGPRRRHALSTQMAWLAQPGGRAQADLSLLIDASTSPVNCNWRARQRLFPQTGFSLLELLVVMVIIGLLASYVAPRYFDQVGKSEVKATRAQLDAFEKALGAYRLDVGRYPTNEQSLRSLVERPADEPKWSGPYLAKSLPPDPWGRAYVFRSPGDGGHDFELQSLGKDGQRGGTGLDADLSVWDTRR